MGPNLVLKLHATDFDQRRLSVRLYSTLYAPRLEKSIGTIGA
jgi:hypothetical protein